jgi:oligopeptide transport system substrate-binding protein
VKQRKLIVASALVAASALALTACGGGSSSGNSGSSASTAALTIYSTKPENPLVPANTNEVGGGNILDAIFRGLVRYNPETAAPELSMAESITSSDNLVWTVKLKTGQTFQDGTPVDSNAFVNAWNWGAYAPNGALNNYFFAPIAGYDVLNPADPDGADGPKKAPTPTSKTLSGLKVDSATQFTVTLSTPQSFFPVEVGYTAFAPLPPAFFTDPTAFGKKPIGNGPFQLTSGDGDTGFTLEKWAGYKGPDQPKIAKAVFKTYTSPDAGYADLLAGNLDFMDQVPASALVNDQFKKDLPGRSISKPVGIIQTATLPEYDKNFKNNPNIGKALSLAIDRPTITKAVFNNGRTPATGWVSPVVDGYKAGACGTYCTYNPTLAKEYLAKSGFKGPFSFSYNSDGPGNKEAAEAICNSIKNALGVTCLAKSYVDFATLRKDVNAHKMTNMFRTGWQMDYPSIQDFLEPLYATGASSNDGLFSDPEFDSLIKKANGQKAEEGLATYQQAEARLSNTMSIIPLWYSAQQSGWSTRLANVKVTPFSTLDLADVTVK